MKVIRSRLTGYCHGVSDTIRKANSCLKLAQKKNLDCYSIGQLIHNNDVSSYYEERGLKIIRNAEDVQPGVALIRAHGISQTLRRSFEEHGFILEDATCVNIKKTQKIMLDAVRQKRTVVLLGVKGHAETLCLQGTEDPAEPGKSVPVILVSSQEDLLSLYSSVETSALVTVVTQTTFPQELYNLLFEKISEHYGDCVKGNSLCYACIKRKQNGEELAGQCQAVVVVGGSNSENTRDLAKHIESCGCPVFCLENQDDIDSEFETEIKQKGIATIGVCSGTSTPSEVIDAVCNRLKALN